MGVYINGMKIPKNCWECSLSDVDDDYGRCCLFSGIACLNIGRQDNCPLIEVPTPHGRLGDLDKLWDRMYNYTDNEGAKMPFGDNDFMIHKDSACELIEDAPTIIEAEGGEE